jgi:hypothetical protein
MAAFGIPIADSEESTISSGARISQPLDGNGQFRVQVRVEVAVTAPQAAPILKVTAVFEITYRLPGGATASEKALQEFASTNAVFNAWPFLREFFVSITQRMDLPPLVLPLVRVGAKTKPARKKRPM